MKYMVLIASGEDWQELDEAQEAATYERIGTWWGEQVATGAILDGHELQGVETATTVRRGADGNVNVTDGPFIEAKESVGGYAIIDVPDLDGAISLVSGWPGPGALEIRPLAERTG